MGAAEPSVESRAPRAAPDAPLRVGVMGAGRIGRVHADLLARQLPGAELAAVNDAVPALAAELAAELGVPEAASPEELLAAPEVDAVAICSSTETHADFIVAAARAGKAIFCEKPVSLDLAEVDRALGAVEAAGVPFQIGFNRRFDPAHESVRTPGIEYVRGSGGIFLDMTIHDFDMARYLTGSEVVQVYATGAVRIEPAFADAGDLDTAVVTLVHESGCITAIDNSRRAVYGYDQRVEVFGSRGMAASENPLRHNGIARTADGTHTQPLPHFFLERYGESYVREWEAFVAALRAGEAPPVGPVDARAPLVIGLAAWRSVREGRTVRVAEVED
jgi:myo-inositol 2-dehydrogenase/D-chiro-inositol 1-dehydrogenase